MFHNGVTLDEPVELCVVGSEIEAEIIDSKLKCEGILTNRVYDDANEYMDTLMGQSIKHPIHILVDAKNLEDAKNITAPVEDLEEEFDAE